MRHTIASFGLPVAFVTFAMLSLSLPEAEARPMWHDSGGPQNHGGAGGSGSRGSGGTGLPDLNLPAEPGEVFDGKIMDAAEAQVRTAVLARNRNMRPGVQASRAEHDAFEQEIVRQTGARLAAMTTHEIQHAAALQMERRESLNNLMAARRAAWFSKKP